MNTPTITSVKALLQAMKERFPQLVAARAEVLARAAELQTQSAQGVEPVAWFYYDKDEDTWTQVDPSEAKRGAVPLYAASANAQNVDAQAVTDADVEAALKEFRRAGESLNGMYTDQHAGMRSALEQYKSSLVDARAGWAWKQAVWEILDDFQDPRGDCIAIENRAMEIAAAPTPPTQAAEYCKVFESSFGGEFCAKCGDSILGHAHEPK